MYNTIYTLILDESMNEKDINYLFKYLENISVRLQRINRHMVFYTVVLVIMLVLQILQILFN